MTQPSDVNALVLAHQAGDPRAPAALLSALRPMVHRWASRAWRPGVDLDDLMQEASVALLDAALTFDPSRGVKFVTWAWRPMRNATSDWTSEHRTTALISGRARNARSIVVSVEEDGLTDTMRDEAPTPEDATSWHEDGARIALLMSDERTRLRPGELAQVLRWLDGKSLEAIGAERGVSRQAVQKSCARTLARLRAWAMSLPEEDLRMLRQTAAAAT